MTSLQTAFRSSIILVMLIGTLVLAGCNSVVYSPSIMAPAQPLQKEQGALGISADALPTTGGSVQGGSNVMVRYAFSNRLTLQARSWATWNALQNLTISGASVEGFYMLNDTSASWRLGLIPRASVMLRGRSIDGRAASLSAIAWTPQVFFFKPYVALGGGIGDVVNTSATTEIGTQYDWGYAILGNLGVNVELSSAFSLNAELSGILQVNPGYGSSYWFVLPSGGVTWTF